MKQSVEISKKSLAILLFVAVFAAVFTLALDLGAPNVANAAQDNFTRVFPQNNYFQSANPTLVSANDNYLIIYDKDAKALFVRPNDASDTHTYAADFEQVDYLFILDDVAFLQADGKYFTIDLTNKEATLAERTLSSPSQITSLASDGVHLYAHYLAGDLTIFDKNLDVAFGVDNQNSSDLVGKIVIAGENDCVYAFPFAYGNAFFVKYNATTKKTEAHPIAQNVTKAYVGDVVYALALVPQTGQKNIVCLDKQSGELLIQTEIYPTTFFAHRNKLFTIEDKSVVVYTLSNDKTTLERTTSITMTGGDLSHLDNPSDLCSTESGIVVADFGNKRLAHIDKNGVMTETKLEQSPIALATAGNEIYCAFENKVCKIAGEQTIKTYELEGVLDVVYLDKLYVLAKDGVYTAIANSLIKIHSVENGKRIAVAKDGINVYVLTATSVVAINRNGDKLLDLASGDFETAKDLAVDYQGKVFVAFEDKITSYYGGKTQTVVPRSSSMKATLTSVYLDNSNLLFTAKESFVGAMSVGATTKDNFEKQAPDLAGKPYYFAKATEGALNYSWDGRLENTTLASKATYLVIDDPIEGDESGEYRFALVGDKLVKITKSDFERVETTTLNGDFVALHDTTLHTLPYSQSGAIALKKDEKVVRVSDVAGWDNSKWTLVAYNDKTYFVNSSDIEEYIVVVPEKDRVYGKANADRVGGVVNVYAAPDKNSELVEQIVDGSKVEVLETLDDFYYVTYDGKVGYIAKDQLKIDGLTTVQIVAIVLAIIVALAGTAIFASIYLTRKNGDEQKKDTTPKRF